MAQASVWGEPCFNSIKVRLKQDAVDFVLNANYFQFHKGPIKTWQVTVTHNLDLVSIP